MAVPLVGTVADATRELLSGIGQASVYPAQKVLGLGNDALAKDDPVHMSAVLNSAGWGSPDSSLNRMARSVVQRESGGNAKAHNPSGATGWFQMMTPLHCGHYGIPTGSGCREWLENPLNNARAAKKLHATSGWSPWATSGPIPPTPTDWDPVVDVGKDTVLGSAVDGVAGVASPLTKAGTAVVDLIGTLLSADTWFRIGKTWMGGAFVVIGIGSLVYIVANQASGGAVKSAGKAAVKTAVTKGVVK